MPKQPGIGDRFYCDGYDISGDIQSLSRIGGGLAATLDVTDITLGAPARLPGLRDGAMEFTSFFNDANIAPLGAFQVLKTLPYADRITSYFHGQVLGQAAASLVAKQTNYDGNRGTDGSFTFTTSAQGNSAAGNGLEWGLQLTPGKRTDTTATNGTGVDLTGGLGTFPPIFPAAGAASVSFGWAAYLHVFAFTGTSVTVTIQDSADNATFTNLTGGAFTAASGIGAQRIGTAPGSTATVRRYARVITSGTFTNAVFAVNFIPYVSQQ
jgi:hypothetical protein